MPSLPVLVIGEWATAAIGLGLTFLVAATGVAGLGWWVLRGDKRNREAEAEQAATESMTGAREEAPAGSGAAH